MKTELLRKCDFAVVSKFTVLPLEETLLLYYYIRMFRQRQ